MLAAPASETCQSALHNFNDGKNVVILKPLAQRVLYQLL
jgi:hypothetical protein